MKISISKMKMVIDELQDAEMTYKRQLNAFENVFHAYQSMEQEGRDKKALRKIFEELHDEYRTLKQLKETLAEIIRYYENAEKNIIKWSSYAIGSREVFQKIEIKEVQRILDKYNIKIM